MLAKDTCTLLRSLGQIVERRAPGIGGHSRRVASLCTRVLRELDVPSADGELIAAVAEIHDLGKLLVPDHVLNKPGELDPDEWAVMETHAVRGAELLTCYLDCSPVVEMVRHHHERWDGQGYPHRLRGASIPLGARVIAVADSFDAMTSDRPYRRACSAEQARGVLQEGRGTQWDATVVDAFLYTQGVVGQPTCLAAL